MSELAPRDQGECLGLGCEVDEIPRLNEWFDGRGLLLGIDEDTLADLKVCINEVVANVIAHGGRSDAAIEVRLWLDGTQVFTEVVDNGEAFDPTGVDDRTAGKDLESETIGGWGIPLMRQLSDHMSYRHAGGRNHTRFVKKTETSV